MNRSIHSDLLFLPLFVFLCACGALDRGATISSSSDVPVAPAFAPDNGDVEKLARLWQERSQDKTIIDFPVGPGDVIELSVPAIEELRARTVRIAGDGAFTLPFVGKVQAAGLTGEQLEKTLGEHLLKYMYNPRVTVFVREYRSRQVAVLGSVARPGMFNLTSGADTLLDVLTQAGGIVPGADPKVYLIPAEPAEINRAMQVVASLPPQSVLQQDPAQLALARAEPILIDIKQMAFGGNQPYLSIAARPGDILIVPGGRNVLVEGWVEKPGAYPVSPGLTVAGVVVQAGGPMYPAAVNSVRVIRSERGAGKTIVIVDLEKIKRGETPDVQLVGGDIVEVSYEAGKLFAYGLYKFLVDAVHIGIGGTVPLW